MCYKNRREANQKVGSGISQSKSCPFCSIILPIHCTMCYRRSNRQESLKFSPLHDNLSCYFYPIIHSEQTV